MSRVTQPYKRSVAGSIGAGMGSLMGGSGKQYFILEHKAGSKYHKAGERQEIIVDQIEIGRDAKCQVRYDESFETVSRRHAAIIRDGNSWKIIPLSQTNPVLLNGNRIAKEWFLQNGDEIQCAVNGPKLGFIIPVGDKSKIGSIGLSRRLSLFRQQALRPYKQAITTLCIFMLLITGGLIGWKLYGDRQNESRLTVMEQNNDSLRTENEKIDSILKVLQPKMRQWQATIPALERQIRQMQQQIEQTNESGSGTPAINNAAIEACIPHVYFVLMHSLTVTLPDGETDEVETNISGTGFLLNDGRFVTARHVVEPWFFFADSDGMDSVMLILNACAHNGGKVVANFKAYSKTGDILTFNSEQFVCNRSADTEYHTEDGIRIKSAPLNETDWAYIRLNKSGGLPFDVSRSTSLEVGVQLTVLGFPQAHGAGSLQDIQPVYGNGTVSIRGLHNGVITTTDTNFEQGNSGGPVFYSDAGTLKVIGIVSAGRGRTIGFIVPVAALR